MKTQRTTRRLLSVTLCTLALGSYAWAGGGFFEDFSDGNIQDGSPVTWGWDPYQRVTGKCQVTPEGLQVTPDWPACKEHPTVGMVRDAYGRNVQYTGSITIRMQVKMPEATTGYGSSVWLFLRGGTSLDNCYFICITRECLWICRMDDYEVGYAPMEGWHYWMNGSFDAKNDVMIQVDAIDLTDTAGNRTTTRFEARWWVAGQAMPVEPQLSVYDAKYDGGAIGIGVGCEYEQNKTAIFRWIEVIGTEIEVEPIVDFNGDGTVDIDDLLRIIESWGQDDPAVDIVPDGVVDKKDLEALMNYWQQDVNDPNLLAHWALDETEGMTASDSARDHDGIVIGLPAWQPAGGAVDGALEFNRTTFVLTDPVLGPSVGPFSIFAWVKGGAPGQAIISQQAGAEWLMADPATGALLTELKGGGRLSSALCSDTVITDGDWHRVGLVWDGTHRRLYVDDLLVAEDTQDGLGVSSGKMLIGCGKNMAAGTFWSGLIDDVRIYNRAVKP
jgi:hypothetical protein